MLQGVGVSLPCLVEQVLQCTAIVKTTAHLGRELVGNVNAEAAALDSAVKDVAWVLVTFKARWAAVTHASGTPQTERSESGGPKARGLFPEPLCHLCWRFLFGSHAVYVPYCTYTIK